MKRVTLDAVLDVAGLWQEAACDESRLGAALHELRQLFGGTTACLGRLGHPPEAQDVFGVGHTEGYLRSYAEHYWRGNLVWQAARPLAPGSIYCDQKLLGPAGLHGSAFWNEWMRPQDMYASIGCRIDGPGDGWAIHVERGRTRPAFDAEDYRLMRKLMPFIRAGLGQRDRFGGLRLPREGIVDGLDLLDIAIYEVGADGQVLRANRAGEMLLARIGAARHHGISALGLGNGAVVARLRQYVQQACLGTELERRGGFLATVAGRSAVPLSLQVSPLSAEGRQAPRALVVAKEVMTRQELGAQLPALFGLTPAEVRVASGMLAGLTAAEIAAMQGLRITTVRTHQARIFQKTETRHQAACVARMQAALLPVLS
ncbi:helix-turn-helix transcriptional regulator [Teichococcus aerofrigidensis]